MWSSKADEGVRLAHYTCQRVSLFLKVPYFRPSISEAEINEVVDSLRSGWLTTGPKVARFEQDFAKAVSAPYSVALNSCTAALHLALEAIGLKRGEMVLVPTMTFAATAEVVRYFDAAPVFVDCGHDLNISPTELERTIAAIRAGEPVAGLKPPYGRIRALIPMHYGGYCCDMRAVMGIANRHQIAVIEDAAHAFPASFRSDSDGEWLSAGRFGKVGCFSFYANKCITTGEGGMAVTDDPALAERIRLMSLHGMSKDAWKRYTAQGSWDYELIAPGFKYNLTDLAAAIGLHQLARAGEFRLARERIARAYNERFQRLPQLETPAGDADTRINSWHLYVLRLRLDTLTIDRARFIDELKARGVACSVHWLPLHLHPYYRQTYGLGEGLFPVAEREWRRVISLPIFPDMRNDELEYVCSAVEEVVVKYAR